MNLGELFQKNPYIVINSDIDGMLSGMILQKYYGCRVIGFSNSWDCVWLDKDYEFFVDDAINKPIYIDLYVTNPNVVCIEQHIIGYDDAHNSRIASSGTKINPNIMRKGRTFSGDYFHKYPFGTVHFLIALMEKEGIQVELPLLHSITGPKAYDYNLTVGDILLRADDALFSSLGKYKANTEEWWPWLLKLSGNAKSIASMIRYISQQDPAQNFKVKDRTGDFFTREFKCSGIDGAFKNVTDEEGNLLHNILEYRDEICLMMRMKLDLPLKYNVHKGDASTKKYFGSGQDLDFSQNPHLYSYAFIFGPRSPKNNFSYTLNMK